MHAECSRILILVTQKCRTLDEADVQLERGGVRKNQLWGLVVSLTLADWVCDAAHLPVVVQGRLLLESVVKIGMQFLVELCNRHVQPDGSNFQHVLNWRPNGRPNRKFWCIKIELDSDIRTRNHSLLQVFEASAQSSHVDDTVLPELLLGHWNIHRRLLCIELALVLDELPSSLPPAAVFRAVGEVIIAHADYCRQADEVRNLL